MVSTTEFSERIRQCLELAELNIQLARKRKHVRLAMVAVSAAKKCHGRSIVAEHFCLFRAVQTAQMEIILRTKRIKGPRRTELLWLLEQYATAEDDKRRSLIEAQLCDLLDEHTVIELTTILK